MKYYNKKRKKESGWKIKNNRPEEILGNPFDYYTKEEVENYSRSGGMKRAQESIAFRVLDFLNLKKSSKILDVGCGTGYTMTVLLSEYPNVEGLDLIKEMVKEAVRKKLKVKQGDMRYLKDIFPKENYNAIVSISALQWIKEREELEKVAKSFYFILKNKGKLIIQFYPKSKEELDKTFNIFNKNGFTGLKIIDNENNPRKRLVFLVLEKV